MFSKSLFLVFGALGAVFVAASCGARTGLDAPKLEAEGGGGAAQKVLCTDGTIALTKADPAVMFVIDRSGSMGSHLGKNNGQGSRWEILTNALAKTLPQVDSTMQVGALLYPAGGNSSDNLRCALAVAPDLEPAKGHVGPLLDLMSQIPPGGATPTASALSIAVIGLESLRAATTARAMVLATDGGPNCNAALDASACRCATASMLCHGKDGSMCLDDARTVERIKGFSAQGLPTYVIGIQDEGDTDFSDVLNAMADAGGRPKAGDNHYYAGRSQAEIETALAAIRDQVGACTYLTTSVPDASGSIVLLMNGVVVPYDPTGKEGWMWGNKSNGEIVLTGATCQTAMGNASLSVDVKCAVQ